MIGSNEMVRQINQYISELISEPLFAINNPNDYSTTISQLNWVGIKTVNQLNDALIKYSEQAKKVASEKFKDFSKGSTGVMYRTLAFFYLCYAILLVNDYNDNEILDYLSENKIGHNYKKALDELLKIKQKL